jgi:hypothetical protein|tara:strand:+ start:872 stop:1147 length:276 start_codon:yes stop_codon:yes gene_type:complete
MSSSFHDSLYDSYVSTITTDFSILYIEDERVQAYFFINKCRRVFGDRCHVAHETDGVGKFFHLTTFRLCDRRDYPSLFTRTGNSYWRTLVN